MNKALVSARHYDGDQRLAHFRCRDAWLSDLPDLLRLVRAYYKFDGIRFDRSVVGAALKRLMRSRSLGRIWIMRDGSNAVGYTVLTFNYDVEFGGLEGILTELFICSKYRKRGLGRQMLTVVYDYCRSLGIRTIELQVEEHNRGALAFYRRLGFKRFSRLVMSRNINR